MVHGGQNSLAHGPSGGDAVPGNLVVNQSTKGHIPYKGEQLAIHSNHLSNVLNDHLMSPTHGPFSWSWRDPPSCMISCRVACLGDPAAVAGAPVGVVYPQPPLYPATRNVGSGSGSGVQHSLIWWLQTVNCFKLFKPFFCLF